MCGINGVYCFSSKGDFTTAVKKMNVALAHRGPDDDGVFSEAGIALGHRRLSIIDLSSAGHQPMHYEHEGKKYTLVFNGELYNFREVKKRLSAEGFLFSTHTDTEVLLAAYAKWGRQCLDEFNGMFGFALYDHAARELFIARDRLGIKPLYYFADENNFVFASEIRALVRSGLVPAKVNRKALGDYLRYQSVHAPHTIIENIFQLEPGTYGVVSPGNNAVVKKTWWKSDVHHPGFSTHNYDQAKQNMLSLFRDAVECRLVSDVPFGAFLSGGIDSSAVVAVMREVATAKVETFSIVFDDSEFSEAVYARRVAKKFSTNHHEIKLTPENFLAELPAALDAMDTPSGDGPNSYVVSKATKHAGITMALSGLGGDELFAGYAIFKRSVELEKKKWLHKIPTGLRKAGGAAIKKMRNNVAGDKMAEILALKEIAFDKFYPLSRRVLTDEQVNSVLSENIPDPGFFTDSFAGCGKWLMQENFILSHVSIAEMNTYMQNILLRDTDQMSMAHALEVRVPFLDYKLVEYVLNLPDRIKYPHTPKKLLVDALGDRLPPEIVNRPKMGFTFPWKHWMKNELKSFCEERLKALGKKEPFSQEGLQELWNGFLRDDARVTWSRVWPLVVLSHWLDKNGIDA